MVGGQGRAGQGRARQAELLILPGERDLGMGAGKVGMKVGRVINKMDGMREWVNECRCTSAILTLSPPPTTPPT